MEHEGLYRRAIHKWGVPAQVNMVFEEIAELQKELCKVFRGKSDKNNIASEIADVEIMLDQLKVIFDIKGEVGVSKAFKLERLEERLNENSEDSGR
jgi:NTP pyrophosphatase (non-canonical NTP hydrolase)